MLYWQNKIAHWAMKFILFFFEWFKSFEDTNFGPTRTASFNLKIQFLKSFQMLDI